MISRFGRTADGTDVDMISLAKGKTACEVITYGCALRSLTVPGSNGDGVDVVLGYDNVADYESRSGRMGAVIGRFANRIANGRFVLDGREYRLPVNRSPDHLHGGYRGFDKKVWSVAAASDEKVTMTLVSPDGDEGYPGNLEAAVSYTLTGNSLRIDYLAHSDRDTICSLTNHSYFNLDGHGSGTVEGHYVRIPSERYTPVDARGIPTGEIAPVAGTPLDLRGGRTVGTRLREYGGFDNNYLVDGEAAAYAVGQRSGISMEVRTDCPAMQFYTGNNLKSMDGKDGARYGRWSGMCFETQYCPDSPNHPDFPSAVLRKDEEYRHRTEFVFDNDWNLL